MGVLEPQYRNIWVSDDYIFHCVVSGVNVYDVNANFKGIILVEDKASSVWANNEFLYIGTTVSGILKHPLTSISGGIFNDLSYYKQFPDITNNGINYIHGNGDYLCATTVSGVDQIKFSSGTHIKTSISGGLFCAFEKCYQTSLGELYYTTKHTQHNLVYNGKYFQKINFSGPVSKDDYQIKVEFNSITFDYSHAHTYGYDIRFFDSAGNKVPYFIEKWSPTGSVIWIKPPFGSSYVYMLYGDENLTVSESDPDEVFVLYDDFNSTTLDTNKWTVVGDPSSFSIVNGALRYKATTGDYLLSSGTVNFPLIIEQYLYKNHGTTDRINYVNTIVPYEEGIQWYKGNSIAREVLFNEVAYRKATNNNFSDTAKYLFTTTISQNKIEMWVEKNDVLYINDVWIGETNNKAERRLKLFAGESTDSNFYIDLYWIRVRTYDSSNIHVSSIDKEQLLYYNNLNVLYDNSSDWTEDSLDYVYRGIDKIFPKEVQINDFFITERTSTSGNTVFLATNNGAVIIGENRADRLNEDVVYYKIK